ncbi:MAG: hypothetical protein DRJ03_31175, partial [Chloroflexi bacterium]
MKWLKKKIVEWLLKDLDELKMGKGTVHITKDYIDLAPLSSDPTIAEGRLWYNASEKALKFSDGTEVDGFDLRLSQLRDDLRGVDNRTLSDLYNRLLENIELLRRVCGRAITWDRMTWISLPNDEDKLKIVKSLYSGRAGVRSAWWDSEVGLPDSQWTLPVTEVGAHTKASPPWNNAIHLRNSKDGTTIDPIYLGVNAEANERWLMRLDAKFPLLDDLPTGAVDVVIGFEVPFQGGTTLYTLYIDKNTAKIIVRLMGSDGKIYVVQSGDISSWVCKGDWHDYYFIVDPPLVVFSDRE